MNRQIKHLAVAGLVLIAALIVGTTWWQTWAAAGLADRQDNAIKLVAQFSIKRGLIRAADGEILATNRRKKTKSGQTVYFRRYPKGASSRRSSATRRSPAHAPAWRPRRTTS